MNDTPSPAEAGFLQDIFAHPEDDTPRLIYADWLDDNHQPIRAEFIRLQCRLARLDPGDPDHDLLQLQERALLKEHRAAWMAHLPVWARKAGTFQRGFVNHLNVRATDYLRSGKKFRKLVYFDSLWLNPLKRAEELLDSGLLAGIRHLTVSGDDADRTLLVRSEQLASLESLEFFCYPIGEEVCQALVSNRCLTRLKRLVISAELGPDQAQILSQAPLLNQLQEFNVNNTGLKFEAMRFLAQSRHWQQLSRLVLAHCWLGPEAVRELLCSRMVQDVTALDLNRASLGEAVRDLARTQKLKNLRYLNLSGNGIDDSGLEALAHATGLTRLTSLDLYFNAFTAQGIKLFAQGPLLSQLHRLGLGWNGLGPDAVKALVASPACGQLRGLSLCDFQLGPEDAAVLAASPYLSRLTSLCLRSNRIGPGGARAIAASTNFPALRHLDVSYNHFGHEGASALAESPLAQQLQGLDLGHNDLRMVFCQQLRAKLGLRVFT